MQASNRSLKLIYYVNLFLVTFCAAWLSLLNSSEAFAQIKTFENEQLGYNAQSFEANLKAAWDATRPQKWADQKFTHQQWVIKAKQALKQNDLDAAQEAYTAAVIIKPQDATSWLALATAYNTAIATEGDSAKRDQHSRDAASTAFWAYKRSKPEDTKLKADALAILASTLARNQEWRGALDAYKALLSIRKDDETQKTYAELNAQHGFRILDHTIDTEAENPRACISFSENLAKKEDFAKFISLDGKDPASVVRQERQLCVEGLIHGQRYTLKVRDGVPSIFEDEKLTKSAEIKIYVKDRTPFIRFSNKNYVLPKNGQNGIPVISVNANAVKIEVHKVGDRALNEAIKNNYIENQVDEYSLNNLKSNLTSPVWSGKMDVKSELNKDITTAFPVNDIIKDIKPGLYVIYASPDTDQKTAYSASQWFVVTDLGLTTLKGEGGLRTYVRSITTAEPLKNVNVKLLARNNEVLGSGKTDDNGQVSFEKGLINGTDAMAPHIVVADRDEGDYAFLDITKAAFDLTDRGVDGRASPGPVDAFLYTERGVYRAGENVYLTGMLRDSKGVAVTKLPLTLVIRRPDGVEYERLGWNDEGDGGRSHIITLQKSAMHGTWNVSVYTDPKASPVGTSTFLVADYVPQRMELKLSSTQTLVGTDKPLDVSVAGRYLYGAPASNLNIDGEVIIKKSDTGLKEFPGYSFGLADETFTTLNEPLADLPKSDADGKAKLNLKLPKVTSSNLPLEAQVTVRLTESGGRAISEKITLPVKPQKTLLGIKPLFEGNSVAQGSAAEFDIVTLGSDTKMNATKGLTWEVFRVETRYQWYNRNGSWNYETIPYTTKIANGSLDTKTDGPARLTAALKASESGYYGGQYRLEIGSDKADGPVASYDFYSGWYSASSSTETPDILEISLDKQSYKAGDEMAVKLKSQTAGKFMVAIVDKDVLESKTIDVNDTGGEVKFTVKKDWSAGAYATAFFYRPMDQQAKRMPSRSIGVAWIKQERPDQTLKISIEAPEKTRPNSKIDVPVKIEGLPAGKKAYLTLAAVDVGILNLTKFETPKPENWYYGQRRMDMEIRDLYGKLIDGMQAAAGKIRSGGDGAGLYGDQPKNVEPVALYSGIITVDENGKTTIPFELPAFDGSVRFMAVAWNEDQLGHAEKEMIIRDPLVVMGTAPLFLTSGDMSNLHVNVDNVEGEAGEFSVKLDKEGPVNIPVASTLQKLKLAQKESKQLTLPIQADGTGTAKLTLTVTGPNNFSLQRKFAFDVHPIAPNVTRRLLSTLAPGGGRLIISKDVANGLIPDTVKVSVNVASKAALDVPGLLLALDTYPYGCAEQTTSRALPLLYMSEMAEKSGVAGVDGAKKRIDGAIERLVGMQMSNGSFGLWGPYGGDDTWLTAYVTDFLTRAKAQGHKVPDVAFENAMNRLQNSVNYAADFSSGGEDIAYALYVLARNGRAVIGDLRYYVDTKLDSFASPLAQSQLGAALAMYGDKTRADQAYQSAYVLLTNQKNTYNYRSDYGSRLRDGAATLTLVSENKVSGSVSGDSIKSLSEVIESVRKLQSYTSTQENAWMLLAAHAMQQDDKSLKLMVNEQEHVGNLQKVMTMADLNTSDMVVSNTSDANLQTAVTVTGDGTEPEPAIEKGFKLSRKIYTLDGKEASLEKVKQNQRFVVAITLGADESNYGRVIVADRLPAGFEIENPSLVDGANTKDMAWLTTSGTPDHTEFHDDKFVASFNFVPATDGKTQGAPSVTVAYIVRAVSPGTYLYPAATVEDMYRPDRYARSNTQKTEILPAGK